MQHGGDEHHFAHIRTFAPESKVISLWGQISYMRISVECSYQLKPLKCILSQVVPISPSPSMSLNVESWNTEIYCMRFDLILSDSVVCVVKRFTMDNASNRSPEDLLKEIMENGISQSTCVNDLGMCLLRILSYYSNQFLSLQEFKYLPWAPIVVSSVSCHVKSTHYLKFLKQSTTCASLWLELMSMESHFSYSEPPAFEVLPTLKSLKQRVLAASRGRYQAVFMSGRYVYKFLKIFKKITLSILLNFLHCPSMTSLALSQR